LRNWDFNNDGITDSTDINPFYTYASPGTYTVNLIVLNENKTASKTTTITVLQATSSINGGSSGGSSHSSGGSIGSSNVISNNSDSTANMTVSANVTPTETNTSGLEQSSTPANVEPTPVQTATSTPAKEGKKTSGFEIICGITGLLIVYLYRRK
jgi:PKD repeat protein